MAFFIRSIANCFPDADHPEIGSVKRGGDAEMAVAQELLHSTRFVTRVAKEGCWATAFLKRVAYLANRVLVDSDTILRGYYTNS